MSTSGAGSSNRPYWICEALEGLLRGHIRETGELSIAPAALTALCRQATVDAEKWVEHKAGSDYQQDGEFISAFLEKQYHERHGVPSDHQYVVLLLQEVVQECADAALRLKHGRV